MYVLDRITKQQRSRLMSRIRGINTKPELFFREMIDGRVLRYQPKGIQGNPDFANKKRKIALFIDGCFWHKCPRCYREPKSNKKFWVEKIAKNVSRDKKNNSSLRNAGWKVVRVWEHDAGMKSIERINRVLESSS